MTRPIKRKVRGDWGYTLTIYQPAGLDVNHKTRIVIDQSTDGDLRTRAVIWLNRSSVQKVRDSLNRILAGTKRPRKAKP